MAAITGVSDYINASSADNITQLDSSKALGKADFLNLLMAELQNQDPLSPMDNKDMILQLAQFSAIEGTQNLNENMDQYIDTANLATASSLIGKQVVYQDIDTGFEMIGSVNKINVVGNTLSMDVDGANVKMYQIKSVYNPPATSE
ncbi:MAG: hypothetical protein A2020_09985 [Lentisphaerae bacterium GWF2_45_14]|nr:MAG: hypothetical protein A2020_09985 [Lentisphaerae bacterium GWF2_45_14]